MAETNASAIPNFVRAGSPIGLRRSMLMNNARLGSMVHYFNIQNYTENGKTVWIAWYFENMDSLNTNDPVFNPKAGE